MKKERNKQSDGEYRKRLKDDCELMRKLKAFIEELMNEVGFASVLIEYSKGITIVSEFEEWIK